eukprot:15324340-Ditylum_brightwellii.AAC.1
MYGRCPGLWEILNSLYDDMVSAIMDDYEINKCRHNVNPFPPTWDDTYTMKSGIAKNIVTINLEVAALQNKTSPFMKENNGL